jgi:hypothetical protein
MNWLTLFAEEVTRNYVESASDPAVIMYEEVIKFFLNS